MLKAMNRRRHILILAGGCLAAGAWAADPGSAEASWPMFRGGPALPGTAAGSLPAKPVLLWSFKSQGPVKSSPAIVGGRVFVGSDDHRLYALNLADGTKIWSFQTGGAIESAPLVLGRKVFVGSSDANLYALDAATGKQLWKYATGDKILGAPNWFVARMARTSELDSLAPRGTSGERVGERGNLENRTSSPRPAPPSGEEGEKIPSPENFNTNILIGSYDFKLHCVDAATGRSNWVYETSNFINGSPAVANGQAVFGGCDAVLHVISLANGKQIKEVEAGAYVAGSVALADGRAYFGHFENQFLCVDLTSGGKVWTFRDREFPFFSSPAVIGDRVLIGGRDKRLHCLNRADGRPVWSFATRGKVDSSPVVCGDKVAVGSDDGRLYLVSLTDGQQLWSYEIGQPLDSSPAVADGKIVIGSDDGSVYCFGAAANAAKR
jgi:outer membrane protein assembly factor BamB